MNKLKSIFITVYLMYAAIIATIQIVEFTNTLDITWLFSATIHLLPVGFIAKLFLVHSPRTGRKLNLITIGMIGLSIAATLVMQHSPESYPLLFVYALITFAGWLLYLNWYSVLPKRTFVILTIGNTFPELIFENETKTPISTLEFLGKKTLYMFFRGNWCPLCMAQIKEISDQYRQLNDQGVQVVLISPQPHSHSLSLAKKFDVPFIFLTDPKGKSAKEINLFHKNGTPMGMEMFGYSSNTILPTVIITDEDGKIIFADQTDNYRVRPEPDTFLKVLETYKQT